MTLVESWLFWIIIFFYSLSSISFLVGFIFRKQRLVGYGLPLCLAGLVFHSATIVVRWVATGHPPLMGDYESALARSWVILALLLLLQLRFTWLRPLAMVIVPFSLLMLGYGALRSPTLQPMTPVFRSPWLFVHLAFAWLAYGAFSISAGLAILVLSRLRQNNTDASNNMPTAEAADELSYRFITFGFIAASVMIVAGAIWANSLWGRYWSWDPIQTWALISWLVYGLYLHLRVIHHWRLRRAAWMSIAAIVTVLVSFWLTNYLGVGLHVF